MKRAAVLYTGGKDSMYTIDILRRGGYEVACLVTVISDNKDSYMLHTANIELTRLSSVALGIPLFEGKTIGKKEIELADISNALKNSKSQFDFDYVACGGIASVYQRARIETIAQNVGVAPLCPLWGIDQKKYLLELVDSGYEFVLTSVSAEGLDDGWLGKQIDRESALEIIRRSEKYGFNPAFEGGEGETLVLNCPLFRMFKLKIVDSITEWNGYFGTLKITNAMLVKKQLIHV